MGLAFAILCRWTWNKWLDPIVDFGREVYVPWRLLEGEVLFGDIAWFNGPLSAYFNALLFGLFGVSIRTLVVANLTLLGMIAGLLFSLTRARADRLTATVATIVFLALFGFGHLSVLGNFNYVAPYSHEATHGLLLGGAALVALQRWLGGRSDRWLVLAGILLGLSFLTKAETFLASLGGCTVQLGYASRDGAFASRRLRHKMGLWLASALVPPFLAFALLLSKLPATTALQGTLGTWPWILRGAPTELTFYRRLSGFLDLKQSLLALGMASGAWLLVLAPVFLLTLAIRRRKRVGTLLAIAAAPLLTAIVVQQVGWDGWRSVGRPLPLFVLLLAAWIAFGTGHGLVDRASRGRYLAWCAFAFLLLLKVILAVGLQGYGFVLAMPATMLLIVFLLHEMPRWVETRGGAGGAFRVAAIALVAAAVIGYLVVAAAWLSRKTSPVGRGGDRFLAGRAGQIVQEALNEIDAIVLPGETLVVVPEGVMINYLARVENGSRYINFMPPELFFFDEGRMVRELDLVSPDYVAMTHRPTLEYGLPRFGEDYGRALHGWLEMHYEPVALYGDRPLLPESKFGIELMRRRRDGG